MFKGTVIDTIIKILLTLALGGILISILPESPFPAIIDSLAEIPYLAYLNWFVPVGSILGILGAWGSAIVIYYGISWIFRQLGIIQ